MKAGAKKGEEAAAKGEAESKVGEGEKAGGAPAPAEPEAIVFKADEEDELELDVEAAKSIAEEEAWNKANKVRTSASFLPAVLNSFLNTARIL